MRAVYLTVYHKSRSGPLEQPRLRGVSVNGAFIRDKFVDYPTAQSTKREIKARSGRRRIPAEIRSRARDVSMEIQRVTRDIARFSLPTGTPATRSSAISWRLPGSPGWFPRKLKLAPSRRAPPRQLARRLRRRGEKESRQGGQS